MRLPTLLLTGLVLSTLALAAVPIAEATVMPCPPGYRGVWVNTPWGPVYMCCSMTLPMECFISRPPN